MGKFSIIGVPKESKYILGYEISGIVHEKGSNIKSFNVGDEVAGILPFDIVNGGCAEYCSIQECYLGLFFFFLNKKEFFFLPLFSSINLVLKKN